MTDIVWFKRDLRVNDHEPLYRASKNNKIIPLYIVEKNFWKQPDVSDRHYKFLTDSIEDLNSALHDLGQKLIIRVGDAEQIFSELIEKYAVETIWSHEETWNNWTYQRDIKLRTMFDKKNVKWQEIQVNGVFRGLNDRKSWSKMFYQEVNKVPIGKPDKLNNINIKSEKLPSADDLGINSIECPYRQIGGEKEAHDVMVSFLKSRSYDYSKNISSPLYSHESCSRLSTYLAFGNISLKQIFHYTNCATDNFKAKRENVNIMNLRSINAFKSRLRWRSHFIQKLEDQPNIESQNLHEAYDSIRDDPFNEDFYQAWRDGQTGFPLIDACMRSLIKTGWINFRMRAMLVSFASNNLWLDWRKFAHHLSNIFTDYEPGIHYSQLQMQSGTTGINTIRIYNPIKQSYDQDKDGVFIKRWVKELQDCPIDYIHEPWKCETKKFRYARRIVDEIETRKKASSQLYSIKSKIRYSETTRKILKKHVS